MHDSPSTKAGNPWLPVERELARQARARYSIREISELLRENGFDRNPKAVEKFFDREGYTKAQAILDAGLNPDLTEDRVDADDPYDPGPLKTSWGDDLLVRNLDLEFGTNTSVVPVVFLPDIHAPFHDPRAIELACKVIELVRPGAIIYLGDNVDWVQVSKFDIEPTRKHLMQEEIDAWQRIDRMVSSAAGSAIRRYYLIGNHEERMYRYHCSHPEISGLHGMQLERLLAVTPAMKVVPNLQLVRKKILWRGGRFVAKHGSIVRKWAGYSARGEIEKLMTSGISGHTHRACSYAETHFGKPLRWVESGCLCNLNPVYVDDPNWQHAVTVGYFNGDGKNDFFHTDLIQFSNYQAIVQGHHLEVK